MRSAQADRQPRWVVDALLAQAEGLFRLGQYGDASALARHALELIETELGPAEDQHTANVLRASAYLTLGQCAGETDDLDASETCLHRAILLSRVCGADVILVRALHNLSAEVYMPRGQFALSISTDEEVLRLAQNRGMSELFWGPLVTMSWVHLLSGQLQRSAARQAELLHVAQPGSLGEGWAHCIAAFLALAAENFAEAFSEFSMTRSLGELLGSPELNFYARLGMSCLTLEQGDLPTARGWVEDASNVAGRIGYNHLRGIALVQAGKIAWQSDNFSQAEAHFQAALEMLTPLKANLDMAHAWLGLAASLLAQKRSDARPATCQALTLIHANGFMFLLDQERPRAYPVIASAIASRDAALREMAKYMLENLQNSPRPSLRVETLGGLQVWQGRQPIPRKMLQKRRAGELLILLLLSPNQRLGLAQAVEALFPTHPPSTAFDLLHQATSALRRALEPDLPGRFPSRYLRVEGQILILSVPLPDALAEWVDFSAFEQACQRQDWEKALSLYRGDFLSEFTQADWSEPTRQRLLLLYQRALLETARKYYQEGQALAALELCYRLLAIEPWQEQAVLWGMRAALALGDRTAAYRLYQALEKCLREELGVTPQAELQDFYRSL